jgi:RNA polymerase sigma factor (sigma-70 family)
MFAGRPAEIIRRLQDPRSQDRERLTRFVRDRDQAAFAELVRTHGSMVLAVCRRVTGHAQDAEDAFQAVFLILARQAAQITRPELLSNYLYGVAVRVAQKVRRGSTRRRQWEMTLPVLPEQETSSAEAMVEVHPILDEELAALPAWYRDAIILCDLRGFSRQEAAAALGVPEGTLSSRLANGHKKLAVRLRKRGLALLAAMIPGSLGSTQAMATVPFELLTKTCAVVARDLAGGSMCERDQDSFAELGKEIIVVSLDTSYSG